jgi:hypothetical protein
MARRDSRVAHMAISSGAVAEPILAASLPVLA